MVGKKVGVGPVSTACNLGFGVVKNLAGPWVKDNYDSMGPGDQAFFKALGMAPTRTEQELEAINAKLENIETELEIIEEGLEEVLQKITETAWKNQNGHINDAIGSLNVGYRDLRPRASAPEDAQPELADMTPGDQEKWRTHWIQEAPKQVSIIHQQLNDRNSSVMTMLADYLISSDLSGPEKLSRYVQYYLKLVTWMSRGTMVAKVAYLLAPQPKDQPDYNAARDQVADYLEMGEEHRGLVVQNIARMVRDAGGASATCRQNKHPAPIGHVDLSVVKFQDPPSGGKDFETLEDVFASFFPALAADVSKEDWSQGVTTLPAAENHLVVYVQRTDSLNPTGPVSWPMHDFPSHSKSAEAWKNFFEVSLDGPGGKTAQNTLDLSFLAPAANMPEWLFYRQEFRNLEDGPWQVHLDPEKRCTYTSLHHNGLGFFDPEYQGSNVKYTFPGTPAKDIVYPDTEYHWPGRGKRYATIRFTVWDPRGEK